MYALLLIEKKKNTLSKLYKSIYMWKHKEVHHPQVTPEVWMQAEAEIFTYVLSLFLLFLSYQQFPLPLIHHLQKTKKF